MMDELLIRCRNGIYDKVSVTYYSVDGLFGIRIYQIGHDIGKSGSIDIDKIKDKELLFDLEFDDAKRFVNWAENVFHDAINADVMYRRFKKKLKKGD